MSLMNIKLGGTMLKTIAFSLITGLFLLSGILAITVTKPGGSDLGSADGPSVAPTKTPLGTPIPYPEPTKDPAPKPTPTP